MFTQTHMHIYMDKHMHAYVYTFDVYIKRKIGIVCKYEDINTIVCKCIFFLLARMCLQTRIHLF